MTTIEEFKARLGEVMDVRNAIALLSWDQETYMPPKAATARGEQLSTLSALAHRLFTEPSFGRMLDEVKSGGLSPDDSILVDETHYDYDRETKLPESFVQEFAKATSEAYQVWVEARKQANFTLFLPHLERIVDLSKRKADYLGYDGSPYNGLLEEYERGMRAEELRDLFGTLAPVQSALVDRIVNAPDQPDTEWIHQNWERDKQLALTEEALRKIGYDFDAGRQDLSVHPFTTNFDLYDVRVTTRIAEDELFSALTGSIHEGGHALYEQGFRPEDRRTTLAQAPSLGIHESQSRLWENIVGRSLPFWKHFAPLFREAYPDQLKNITSEQMYQAINAVSPSLIRVEADECTYNLHVILRFEIEVDLMEEKLAVRDVPEVWNAKIKEYLGLDVPNDREGCLQDIHWSHGSIGYFPTYALGNLYASQLFEQILCDVPDLWGQIESGDFTQLLAWLRENVHQHGRRLTTPQIIQEVTGQRLNVEPYLRYLEEKYSGIYGL